MAERPMTIADLLSGTPPQNNWYQKQFADLLAGKINSNPVHVNSNPLIDASQMIALAASPIPGIGDLLGLAADVKMYATQPRERTLPNAAMTLAGLIPGVQSATAMKAADDVVDLYHGSNGALEAIHGGGTFGGIFAGSKGVAQSHGDQIYKLGIPKAEIARNHDLAYETPWEDVQKAIKEIAPQLDDADMDTFYKAVVEDMSHKVDEDDLMRIFGADDMGEASWAAQKARGQLAKKLGYGAVEMADEHGGTYLVVKDYPKTTVPRGRQD